MAPTSILKLTATVLLSFSTAMGAIKTGPNIGEKIPAFSAPDQNGTSRDLKSITGPKGAMLVFYRSADW